MMSLGIHAQNTEFESATEAVKNMKIGWNLWNTLESVVQLEEIWFDPAEWQGWETAWGNPITKPELMKMMRKAGINAIRVPVTWYLHMDANDQVDPVWMKRVHEVVDYVIDQGMYCILNTHHDNGAWLVADMENYVQNKERFEYLWRQIAEEFKDYDEHLVFEGYNEIVDKYGDFHLPNQSHGAEHIQQAYDAINGYAQSFVDAVRSTGGKNLERNLAVGTYSALVGPWEEHGESCRQMKIPTDVSEGHIIFAIHCYWMESKEDVDGVISNVDKYITSRGIPTIVGEWGAFNEGENHYEDYHGYFIGQTKAKSICTFLWGGMSGGEMRSLPAFEKPEEAKTVLKAYYGNEYEPTLLTKDDYEYLYYPTSQVTFRSLYAQLSLCSRVLSLNDYTGIRIEMENTEDIHVLINGDGEGKQQRCWFSASSETFYFDKSILGEKVTGIELQNMRDGKNETKIYNVYLIKKDGSEEKLGKEETTVVWGCDLDNGKWTRKQFVHTVEYDYQWAELNIFYDDIPLKLKNYKGIRLELAEMPTDVHVKVYGDGGQKEEYIGINDASSTILFNTDIFSNEINRVTLQYTKEGKGEAKVISAWLIRQDGTEEYSDLSPFHGCNITNVEKYVPESPVTITADDLSMTYGDDVPVLTYTSTGAALSGTPTLSTTATKTSPVGSYPIKVEKGTVTNNNVTYVDGTLTITKAPLTVGVQNVTITEGDVIPTFTLTYSGLRNGDTENTAFTTKPVATTTAVALSKAGTYPITVSGGEATNYALSYTQGTLTIKEKVVDPVTSGELVINGSLSGHDLSCFYARENYVEDNTIVHATIGVRSGKDRTRGIVVQSTNNPPEIWNTQFFVRLPQTLPAGTKYRFSFDYKATQNADVNMECHKEPSEFIYWDFGNMSFTTSWKHYESEGIITSEQSPNNNQMRTIAFNLSHISTATTYYFDNISFIINPTTGIGDVMADDSTNGVVYNLSGQKLSKPKKGINIVNGRKVVVK